MTRLVSEVWTSVPTHLPVNAYGIAAHELSLLNPALAPQSSPRLLEHDCAKMSCTERIFQSEVMNKEVMKWK